MLAGAALFAMAGGGHALDIIDGPDDFGGNRYYVLESASWQAARQEALALGGDLVSIESQAEQDFLVSAFGAEYGPSLWIGLNDLAIEGAFGWGERRARHLFELGGDAAR